jgi:hypothetical protein
MEFVYYGFLLTILYVFLGLGLSALLCPRSLAKYVLLLSPMIGYCYLTLIGWYGYNIDRGGTDVYASLTLVPPALLLIYVFLSGKLTETYRSPADRDLLWPLGVGMAAFLFLSLPFLTHGVGLTSVAISNNDIADSSSISRVLKEFSRSDTVGFLSQSRALKYWAEEATFGGPFSTAVASSVFSLQPYQLQTLSLCVFFMFSVFLVYVVARDSFRYSPASATGVAALYSVNPIMHYLIFQGYQGQVIATGLSLCVVLVCLNASRHCLIWRDYYAYLPLAVLLSWGIHLTYPHMLPFVYAPLGTYLVLLSIRSKSPWPALRGSAFILLGLVLMFALSPHRAKAMVSIFAWMGNIQGGFPPHPLVSPDMFFGLISGNNGHLEPSRAPIRALLSVVMIGAIVLGCRATYRKDASVGLLALSFLTIIPLGYILLFYRGNDVFTAQYKSYKLLSFFLPLLLLSSLLLFRDAFASSGHRRHVLAVCLVVLFAVNISAAIKLLPLPPQLRVTGDMAELQAIEKNSAVRSVNILGSKYWDILWGTYFLMHKPLYFETTTYDGRTAGPLDGEWDLIKVHPNSADWVSCGETMRINSIYALRKASCRHPTP